MIDGQSDSKEVKVITVNQSDRLLYSPEVRISKEIYLLTKGHRLPDTLIGEFLNL